MKKLFLTIAVLGALATTTMAQNANKTANDQPALTVEQKADKETTRATAALGLSDAQKATFKKLAIERFSANKPLREQGRATTDKTQRQSIHDQIKKNNEKFFTSVNSMLTPEQQTKWADHRKKMGGPKGEHQD
jgi:LPS O-antigen subunit length determinant protein (WzzB/FepE family)